MKHMYKNWTIFKTKSFLLQVFEMLINPGDNILLDAPTYSGTLAAVSIAYQQNIVNVTFELNSILVPDLQSYKHCLFAIKTYLRLKILVSNHLSS